MSENNPAAIYLKDYTVPNFLIDKTELTFDLDDSATVVTAKLHMRRNPASAKKTSPLILDGGEDVKLIGVAIDDYLLPSAEYHVNADHQLVITATPDAFVLTVETLIEPQNNTRLEGLYRSSSMFCTQCEAEGFRHITYYLDRPDVMSVFTTTLVADEAKYPTLLSNGNEVDRGQTEEGKTFVTWHDPHPKPAYLFALVAGDLAHITDTFTTCSGKEVTLKIFTEPHNIDKVEYAMGALKRSMKWDEDVYGREYDLDIFMIVAVDDFNMGAMENKGLNIFNSSCLLARQDTTTDDAYLRIEAIVAHEYFHNWSGNRVTCRDWFQLSLKEGFTVFRDQSFSQDLHSATVKRVEDVSFLRTAQFAEDAGPMSHPIRPASYIEISNFYTLTVYEKGSEVVRMLHTLLGEEGFRKGSDLYFERHDGQAATCDQFVAAMEDANGVDLSQFKRWYSQAGTPRVSVTDEYDEQAQQYRLTFSQSTPATPNQPTKLPVVIPVKMGLMSATGETLSYELNGQVQTESVLEFTESEQVFVFNKVASKPVPSLLRGFSAPVKLSYGYPTEELSLLVANDPDGFNRWNSAQQIAVNELQAIIKLVQAGDALPDTSALIDGFKALLEDESLDPAMVALILVLPSPAYLAELADEIDPHAIKIARDHLRDLIATQLTPVFAAVYARHPSVADYVPEGRQMAERSLRNTALSYWVTSGESQAIEALVKQYNNANNMTDQFAALSIAVHLNTTVADQLMGEFYEQWKSEPLVVNKWLTLSACRDSEQGLGSIQSLLNHESFDWKNPNKIRSVFNGLGLNTRVFHHQDGSGYRFLAEQIGELDKRNPQIASRLCTPLTRWRKMAPALAEPMRAALTELSKGNLSKDVYEVVSKSLA